MKFCGNTTVVNINGKFVGTRTAITAKFDGIVMMYHGLGQ